MAATKPNGKSQGASLLIVIFCLLSNFLEGSGEIISLGVASGTAAVAGLAYTYGGWAKCKLYDGECCDTEYIKPDFSGLAAALSREVYGQHLVRQATVLSLKAHFQNHQPSKALALSFHGMTGTGKNYVSKIIVDHIYKKGMKSRFVHFFSATHHFPHVEKISEYREVLRNKIIEAASACERTMFIFDEMDKMPPRLIDIVTPYLDYHPSLDQVDYRKTTFIFMSNSAGAEISRMALEHWGEGKERADIKLADLQSLITVGAYNYPGGWWHNALMERHLISVFVPFLPLERSHVKRCIINELNYRGRHCDPKYEDCIKKYNPTEELVKKILDMMLFFPSKSPVFATSGCKRVTDSIALASVDAD